jgi:ElaB/YqjD/DUF883 family membrane-anchored ribosome-binding protein
MASKISEIDDIREDLAQLRSDLKALMKAVNDGDVTRDVASGIASQASRIAEDLEDSARRTYDRVAESVGENAQHYSKIMERAISEHPFSAATIALALGVMLSRFLERSDR